MPRTVVGEGIEVVLSCFLKALSCSVKHWLFRGREKITIRKLKELCITEFAEASGQTAVAFASLPPLENLVGKVTKRKTHARRARKGGDSQMDA